MDAPGIISNRLYPEHYFGRENTIFIGKVTSTAVFVGNVADGFDSYAVSGAFGGLENIVFLMYFAIKGILHMNQKQMCIRDRHSFWSGRFIYGRADRSEKFSYPPVNEF